jgi:hypothetical protein
MAIGGWNNDPAPTLNQFIDDIQAGKITYCITPAPKPGQLINPQSYGPSNTGQIANWVIYHYTAAQLGTTLQYYRLTDARQ